MLGFIDGPIQSLSGFELYVEERAANMHSTILELNQGHGAEAGLTASYCWEFITKHKERKDEFDIELDGGNFQIRCSSRAELGTIHG